MLPYIKEIGKTRSYIGEFRGYNHNARISEYEIYDGYNMTNDEYPVLSTRKPRGKDTMQMRMYHGIYGANGLCVIYSDDDTGQLHFEYNDKEHEIAFAKGYERRNIVGFGTKLLIFPDNVWFDTVTGNSGKMKARYPMYSYELRYGEPDYDENGNGDMSGFEVDNDFYRFNFEEGKGWYIANKAGNEVTDVYVMLKIPSVYLSTDIDEAELRSRVGRYVERMGDTIERRGDYLIFKGVISTGSTPYNRMLVDNGNILFQEYEDGEYNPYTPEYKRDMTLHFNNVSPPLMDHVIECQNRLWGCRKGENRAGAVVNEIYATRLGTFDDWYSYEDTADSPYVASIGTPGEFTGAIALSQNPIFFKENAIHKVYVSSSGAHQIYTYDVRGVQRGSGGSIAVVNETAYFKGVRDVFAFDGTNVSPISDALGDVRYFNALAGADGDKYVMYCEDSTNGRYIFTYDTRKGFWQRELIDERVVLMCEESGRLLIGTDSEIFSHEASPGEVSESRVRYMLETGEIGFESADARFLCRLDLRVKLGFGSTMTVWVEYDSDGGWCEALRHRGTTVVPRLETVNILPRRAGHFKIRITGTGEMRLYGMQRIYEESTG